MITVERNADKIAVGVIPARNTAAYAVRCCIIGFNGNIDIIIVIEYFILSLLAWRASVDRFKLNKVTVPCACLPRFILN